MIIGIGTDLVDITRIQKALSKHGDKFETRMFTPNERAYAMNQANPAASFAKRFAAKEAFSKALGFGLKGLSSNGKSEVSFQDFEIINDELGKPEFVFSPKLTEKLQALKRSVSGEQEGAIKVHLSLSDELPFAMAYVMIELIES
ncbi:MAG: holo-ACP synthase [Parvibaculales bacterium]